MDLLFVEGVAATVSAILIFAGSVFFILSLVMGARLAYFVTASVFLAFLLMMGVVWSFTQLGPVGQLPRFEPLAIGQDANDVDFGPISEYPEGPWRAPDPENEAEVTQQSELENEATAFFEQALQEGRIKGFEEPSDAVVNQEKSRLIEQDGETFGAVTLEPAEGFEGDAQAVAVLKYDPGNPLGTARLITIGTLVLFVLHLVGLSRAEARARRLPAAETT